MKNFKRIIHVIHNVIIVRWNSRKKRNLSDILLKWYSPSKPLEKSIEPLATWIGQSTFLLQIDGVNILTDPIFSNATFVYPRLLPPGISLSSLPPIHVILISHNHIDHMEEKSLKFLQPQQPLILAPYGDGKWFSSRGFKNVAEHHWGDHHIIAGETHPLKFTFLPTAHWTGRSLFFAVNKSKCGSWMIEHNNTNTYFAGDTAYASHFTDIAKDFPSITTALLPVGPIEPRRTFEHVHIDSTQAVQAFLDLKAQQFIPMHWGTYQFGSEDFEHPIKLLETAWKDMAQLKDKRLMVLKFGKSERL